MGAPDTVYETAVQELHASCIISILCFSKSRSLSMPNRLGIWQQISQPSAHLLPKDGARLKTVNDLTRVQGSSCDSRHWSEATKTFIAQLVLGAKWKLVDMQGIELNYTDMDMYPCKLLAWKLMIKDTVEASFKTSTDGRPTNSRIKGFQRRLLPYALSTFCFGYLIH